MRYSKLAELDMQLNDLSPEDFQWLFHLRMILFNILHHGSGGSNELLYMYFEITDDEIIINCIFT